MAARSFSRLVVVTMGRSCVGFQQRRRMPLSLCAPALRMLSSSTGSNGDKLVFTSTVSGQPGTEEFRISFTDAAGKEISPWHDIPLENGNYYNFVCEIPRHTKAKLEVAKDVMHNPIVQDKKDNKPRFYEGPIYWNYGYLPQTWENPYIVNPVLNLRGDNDPLDVVEIGSGSLSAGSVTTVKVLGILAMVDCGELDWKVLAIDVSDRLAAEYHDVTDIPDHVISGIREWFRWYKTPTGKPLNTFEFDEMCMPAAMASEVIAETHEHWLDLVDPEEGREIATEDRIWTGKGFSR